MLIKPTYTSKSLTLLCCAWFILQMVMAGKGSFVIHEVWAFLTVITGDVCHLFTIFIAKLKEP